MISAMIIPTIGASKIKLAVFKITAPLIVLNPPCAIAAPAKPPIRVCEDDEGMPNHQVSRFHEIAAINPEKITTFMSGPGIISLCTVLATVSESEEHTSELQSQSNLVCRLLLEKKNKI